MELPFIFIMLGVLAGFPAAFYGMRHPRQKGESMNNRPWYFLVLSLMGFLLVVVGLAIFLTR